MKTALKFFLCKDKNEKFLLQAESIKIATEDAQLYSASVLQEVKAQKTNQGNLLLRPFKEKYNAQII